MNIVITTPTGNIGSVVTRLVLDAGEKPVLIARDPAKLQDAVSRGATVVKGSHDDVDLMIGATRDAEALFVLVPTNPQVTDIRAHYSRFAEAAATAATTNDIPHVVLLSSIGADLESGNGPVAGLYAAERILDATSIPNLTHLRPGYFMENTLAQIPSIQQAGSLFSTFPTGTRFPMIATRDIGARAADLLLNRGWVGRQVVELHGPGETSYDEVAEILTKVLEREIKHVTISDEQMLQALTGLGMSQVMAESLIELSDAITRGRVKYHEPRTKATTTPTTYLDFAKEVFRPAFGSTMKG